MRPCLLGSTPLNPRFETVNSWVLRLGLLCFFALWLASTPPPLFAQGIELLGVNSADSTGTTLSSPDSGSAAASATGSPTPKIEAKWTILHYAAVDNNLKGVAVENLNKMETTGSTKQVNIVSFVDNGDGCAVYWIQKDGDLARLTSPVLKQSPPLDSADPKVFLEFLTSMIDRFPAEHYAVFIGSHGAGWKGTLIDRTSETHIKPPALGKVFEDVAAKISRKVDVVVFDACLMAAGEVASELANSVNYMVASQMATGISGYPYDVFLGKSDLDLLTGRGLAEWAATAAGVDNGSIDTVSVLDLAKIGQYEAANKRLSDAVLATATPNSVLKKIADETTSHGYDSYKDHRKFAASLAESLNITDTALKEAAREVVRVIKDELVIKNAHSPYILDEDVGGVNIEVPTDKADDAEYKKYHEEPYQKLRFDLNTGWHNAVTKFRKG